ncbi:MAG: DUF2007 domain-containing protein [Vibrio gallaecicus]|uniref:putative signal transducing protein n=1 Tax=Vibrio TaxID=662 RepID=UPI0010C9A7C7|nr:DUF2007 domain-containing protein [Vibrio gallaecicus]MDN3614603.1 DUF2007 domain-containing protein [Vibrio gallaecicus]
MKIFIASNPAEAHIVCGLLQSENVECEVRGEGLFGLKGELPFTEETDPYVWLPNTEYAPRAKVIVEEYQLQQTSIQFEEWVCENCRENNEPQFGSCWQCGAQSPQSEVKIELPRNTSE